MYKLILILILSSFMFPAFAGEEKSLNGYGSVNDPIVEAQEKLLHAKGSYKTVTQQKSAIEDLRKATKLSLKAAKLRAKAEKLQGKSDLLVNKANQFALSRGLYITNPLSPVMMQPPPATNAQAQTAQAPAIVPVPGQPINIIVPKKEEVSYQQPQESSQNQLPEPPTLNDF